GRQHRLVIDPGLDIADPMARRLRGIHLTDRHEFIEDAVVEIDAHALALSAIGAGDEPLAGGVDLARLSLAAREPFGKTRAVRREIHPAMHEQLELRKKIDEPRATLRMPARQLVEE